MSGIRAVEKTMSLDSWQSAVSRSCSIINVAKGNGRGCRSLLRSPGTILETLGGNSFRGHWPATVVQTCLPEWSPAGCWMPRSTQSSRLLHAYGSLVHRKKYQATLPNQVRGLSCVLRGRAFKITGSCQPRQANPEFRLSETQTQRTHYPLTLIKEHNLKF